jgi:hypothetical protein
MSEADPTAAASKKRKTATTSSVPEIDANGDDTAVGTTAASEPPAAKKKKAYKPRTTTVRRGRKISALPADWVDGRLEIIPEGVAVASTIAELSSDNVASSLASDAKFPPVTLPAAENQADAAIADSASADAPGSVPAPVPESTPRVSLRRSK